MQPWLRSDSLWPRGQFHWWCFCCYRTTSVEFYIFFYCCKSGQQLLLIRIYALLFVTKCQNGHVCVCVCVCERDRERERERERQMDREPLRYNIFRFTSGRVSSLESLASLGFFHGRLIQGRLTNRGILTSGIAPKTAWLLTDCSLIGVENFRCYIFFGHIRTLPTQSRDIYAVFCYSSHG